MNKGTITKKVATKAPVKAPVKAAKKNTGLNRAELIEVVSKKTKLSKTQADAVLASVIETIQGSVNKGHSVKLVGFGTFKKVTRKARTGVNPKTKAEIQIPKKTVAKFTASKTWKIAK